MYRCLFIILSQFAMSWMSLIMQWLTFTQISEITFHLHNSKRNHLNIVACPVSCQKLIRKKKLIRTWKYQLIPSSWCIVLYLIICLWFKVELIFFFILFSVLISIPLQWMTLCLLFLNKYFEFILLYRFKHRSNIIKCLSLIDKPIEYIQFSELPKGIREHNLKTGPCVGKKCSEWGWRRNESISAPALWWVGPISNTVIESYHYYYFYGVDNLGEVAWEFFTV